MTDLAAFLLARIAEDEREAMLAHEPTPQGSWDSFRVAAECDAKRRIVQWCSEGLVPGTDPYEDYGPYVAEDVLKLLALPYAEHDDYREEWAWREPRAVMDTP